MEKKIKIYDKTNIEELNFPISEDGEYAKKYLIPYIKNGPSSYIDNVQTDLKILYIDNLVLPITINNKEYNNSYVVSPYTHYISYSKEELKELKTPLLELILKCILNILGVFLRITKINKVVQVNNWIVSTNLYVDLDQNQINAVTEYLTKNYPGHAVVFKSINNYSCEKVYKGLVNCCYRLIASRQVYIGKNKSNLNRFEKSHISRDLNLIKKNDYVVESLVKCDDKTASQLVTLYNSLYLDKYSKYNPQFNKEFIKLGINEGLFNVLCVKKDNSIDAFYGYFKRNGFMTAPLFGYNIDLPKERGLYRILSSKLYCEAQDNNLKLHLSSGAASFKRNRGGFAVIEYNAVYLKHLPFYRRLGWIVLEKLINKIAISLLNKYKL